MPAALAKGAPQWLSLVLLHTPIFQEEPEIQPSDGIFYIRQLIQNQDPRNELDLACRGQLMSGSPFSLPPIQPTPFCDSPSIYTWPHPR